MFDDARTTRRKLLGGSAVALSASLAGCGSVIGGQTTTTPASGSGDGESSTPGRDDGTAANYHAVSETAYGIDLTSTPVLGSTDADVDVLYWSDYQCPFCEEFETETFPKLVANEIAAGRVRLLFFQFPNIGSASTGAAMLARAVWHQVRDDSPGRFGAWHATVFDHQGRPNSGWADYGELVELTREVDGVDAGAVDEYVRANQGALNSRVETEQRLGSEEGISGTPGFVLYETSGDGRTRLMGAQPYPRFETAIERLTG